MGVVYVPGALQRKSWSLWEPLMSYHSSLFGIDEAVHNSTRCMHLFMKCDKSWVICGHKRMHVHSLTKPTSSVKQLAVYKPERRGD